MRTSQSLGEAPIQCHVEPARVPRYDPPEEQPIAETIAPWGSLAPGDRFVVANRRGELYEPLFIRSGPPGVGLYVRLADAIGRLHPEHFDWGTFQRLLQGELLVRGDQVLLEVQRDGEGLEVRGAFMGLEPGRLLVAVVAPEKPMAVPLRDVMSGSFRLLLPTKKLLAGEEFVAITRGGAPIRGIVRSADETSFAIEPLDGAPATHVAREELNPYTINVLIPVPLAASDESVY